MNLDEKKHPFLDDLTEESELHSTILREPIRGINNIRRVVDAVGSLYVSQVPTFYGSVDGRHFLQYQATLRNGRHIEAVGVIERDGTNIVRRVTMTFSPLDAAMSLSADVGLAIGGEAGVNLFL